jgi:putative ABC transport system permease protein
MERSWNNLLIALDAVRVNHFRAILTALGILFGVAAVISMLAIGSGAKQAIIDQMKLIGSNNIIIKSVVPNSAGNEENSSGANATNNATNASKKKRPWSPGLSLQDLEAIRTSLPRLQATSPELTLNTMALYDSYTLQVKTNGIRNDFFKLNNLALWDGNFFSAHHFIHAAPVCIVGKEIMVKLFRNENPIGKKLKLGAQTVTVIGVLQPRISSSETLKTLGLRSYNAEVFIPIETALIRFEDRSLVSKKDLSGNNVFSEQVKESANYHQLDQAIIQVEDASYLSVSADYISSILKRRHLDQIDFQIEIPELLIQQKQKTQETFNLVLAVIAAISLLVGGIGIMNIMLASVLERIKEIGLRRSLGALQQDIVQQFLFEAIIISFFGGLVGILLGVLAARLIASYADIPTIISGWSVLLAFGVSVSVGIVFGLFPSKKAAAEDPIKALRVE